jgi:hypothetical protein
MADRQQQIRLGVVTTVLMACVLAVVLVAMHALTPLLRMWPSRPSPVVVEATTCGNPTSSLKSPTHWGDPA